jgi:hypothetical protein
MPRHRPRFFQSDIEAQVQSAICAPDPFDPHEVAKRLARQIEAKHDGRVVVEVRPKFYFVGTERRVRYELASKMKNGAPA